MTPMSVRSPVYIKKIGNKEYVDEVTQPQGDGTTELVLVKEQSAHHERPEDGENPNQVGNHAAPNIRASTIASVVDEISGPPSLECVVSSVSAEAALQTAISTQNPTSPTAFWQPAWVEVGTNNGVDGGQDDPARSVIQGRSGHGCDSNLRAVQVELDQDAAQRWQGRNRHCVAVKREKPTNEMSRATRW